MITRSPKIELKQLNPGMTVRTTPSYILGEQGNFTYLSHLLIQLPMPIPLCPVANHTPGGLIISHNCVLCRESLREWTESLFDMVLVIF